MRRVLSVYGSSVGKKAAMAITGYLFVGFVVVHMLGNLKVFQGPEKFNAYAEFLREAGYPIFGHGQLLWILRIVLLVSVTIHIAAAIQLSRMSHAARPVGYRKTESIEFSYASRTMRWGGVIITAFVIYHLMHFTWGTAHRDFIPGDAYHNFVTGFQTWPVALAYAAAMIFLGLHVYHGVWSGFQTLGANHPRYNRHRRPLAAALAILIVAGFLSGPAAVLAGIVR
ncbi:MAG: succinate dehydrogenase cytochrome b subunit [Gemmatimonadota bacterium]